LITIGKGESPIIYWSRKQTRIFILIEDVVAACLYSIDSKKCVVKDIIVGSGIETSINLFTCFWVNLLDLHNIILLHAHARTDDIRQSHADLIRANRLLGDKHKMFLRRGLNALRMKLEVKY